MSYIRRLADRVGHSRHLKKLRPIVIPIDKFLDKRTGGRWALADIGGLPMARLHVRGWKTGEPRTITLLYVPHGNDVILVGSNWGGDKHPMWTKNLMANPDCEVTIKGVTRKMRSHLATGAEREQLWAESIRQWPAYQQYQDNVGRELRLFLLTAA